MCIRRFRSEATNSRIASRWEVIFSLANEHRFLVVTNNQQKLTFRFCIVYCILLKKKKKKNKCTCIKKSIDLRNFNCHAPSNSNESNRFLY